MSEKRFAFNRVHRRRKAPENKFDIECIGTLRYFVPKFNREFNYTILAQFLNESVATELAEAHANYITRFSRDYALSSFQIFRRFGEFAKNENIKLEKYEKIYEGPGGTSWARAVSSFIEFLENSNIALTTYAELIGNLFRFLDELTSLGIATKCERPRLPDNYHASGKHRLGLLEQTSKKTATPESLNLVKDKLKLLGISPDSIEVSELLLAYSAQVSNNLDDEVTIAEAILRENAKALANARQVAEDTYIYWRDVWRQGQKLLKTTATSEVHKFPKVVAPNKNKAPTYPVSSLSIFSPELGDIAMGNFLKSFNEEFGAYVPSEVEINWPKELKKYFWELGGRDKFDACFCLHRQGVAAAAILYLVDSGANISTMLNMTTDSEQVGDDSNFVIYSSFKDRAGPGPIIKELPLSAPGVNVTAAQALRELREMTEDRRKLYPELLKNKLFIFSFFKNPSILSSETLANNFKYMLRDRNMHTFWTPSAIRIAVAIEVGGEANGNMEKIGRKLSHAAGSQSTKIYGLRSALRLLLSRKIRDFQYLLEGALSTHTNRGPFLLGYSGEEAEIVVEKAIRTGLGFLCKDATVYGGKVDGQEASCPKLGQGCTQCHSRVFIVDKNSLTEIIAVNQSLSRRLEATGEAYLDKWSEQWLDLYTLSTAIIQKVKRSHFAKLIPIAQRNAQSLLDSGFDPILIQD